MTWRSLGESNPRFSLERAITARLLVRRSAALEPWRLRQFYQSIALCVLPSRRQPAAAAEFQERVAAILRANPDPGPARSTRRYAQSCTGCCTAGSAAVGRSVAVGALGKAMIPIVDMAWTRSQGDFPASAGFP